MAGSSKYHLIVVAGGSGTRMGATIPKQFMLLKGRPILAHTLESFARWRADLNVVVVLPEAHLDHWQNLIKEHGVTIPHRAVAGGTSRFASVQNGLQAVGRVDGVIGVHDGVRPLVTSDVMERCFKAALEKGGAVPVLPVVDSLRKLSEQGSSVVDRGAFRRVQTPQCFEAALLLEAYQQAVQTHFTDSASVVEALGHAVKLVDGEEPNLKITTPVDLAVAEAILNQRESSPYF